MADLKLDQLVHGADYYPEQWLKEPEVIEEDFKLFKSAKLNSLYLGVFSWAKLEPEEGKFDFAWLDDIFDRVEAVNGHVVLATPSGAKPRWVADKYPEVLRVDNYGRRQLFGERENHCFTSPIYREKVQQIDRRLAERYGKRKSLVLWHVSNEFNGDCHCDLCQAAFRKWIQNKYQTLDNLNHAYWADFWAHTYTDWSQVHSPSPLGDSNLIGLNLDWHRFVTDQTISFFDMEANTIRPLSPDVPVTTNFMGGNPPDSNLFYDLDYHKFAKHVDVIGWDSYPNWGNDYESTAELAMQTALMNDVMRGFKHQPYLIMEGTPTQVNWHPFNRSKRPGMHELTSLLDVAHGANGINYFQMHQSRGSSEMFHGAVVTHSSNVKNRGFEDIVTVGEDLQKLRPVLTAPHRAAKVAIIYDYDNMWALDDSRNYADSTKKYWQTIQEQYRYFWEHDIPVEMLGTDDDLSPYALVIDPMHFLMAPAFVDKLHDYVNNGGTLVGTYLTGRVDDNFLAYPQGWPEKLSETYGIDFQETDTLYPKQHNTIAAFNQTFDAHDYCDVVVPNSATIMGLYEDEFYANTPAVTANSLGKGHAYYVAARTGADFLNAFYDQLAKQYQMSADLNVAKATTQVSIQVRENETATYYFVLNLGQKVTAINLKEPMHDLLNDREVPAGNQLLAGYGVAVYQTQDQHHSDML